ncbi:Pkinase-fungal domain-containing protein [Pseudohyphozyma bogoriensis]|nr:Pkinase-fungal domain-containing protein [Pseudohyphozyma bogoriensis]
MVTTYSQLLHCWEEIAKKNSASDRGVQALKEITEDVWRMAGGILSVTLEGGFIAKVEKSDPEGGKMNTVTSCEKLGVVSSGAAERAARKVDVVVEHWEQTAGQFHHFTGTVLAYLEEWLYAHRPVQAVQDQFATRLPGIRVPTISTKDLIRSLMRAIVALEEFPRKYLTVVKVVQVELRKTSGVWFNQLEAEDVYVEDRQVHQRYTEAYKQLGVAWNYRATVRLEALEESTRAGREAVLQRLNYVPGRPYPDAPQLGSDASSRRLPPPPRLLATDDERVASTITDRVTETGVSGSVAPKETAGERNEDREFCIKHGHGRVTFNEVEGLLERMGGQEMVDRYIRLVEVARSNLMQAEHADKVSGIFECYTHESDVGWVESNVKVNGKYWLCALAEFAADRPSSEYPIDYFPTGGHPLPTTSDYKKQRKYDAALRPSAATRNTIFNSLANVEFTTTSPPNLEKNPLLAGKKAGEKVRQGFCNAVDMGTHQPTRVFVPSLSFHGPSTTAQHQPTTTLIISLLDSDQWEFATITECFKLDNLPSTAALVHLLRLASPYELGLNPFLEYSFARPPSGDFSFGDILPSALCLPDQEAKEQDQGKIKLNPKPISPLRTSPFSRSTVVYAEEDSDDVGRKRRKVVKIARISNERPWRERVVVVEVTRGEAPSWCPTLVNSYAEPTRAHNPTPPLEAFTTGKKRQRPVLNKITRRHIEIYVFDSPANAVRLGEVANVGEFKSVAVELFGATLAAYEKGVAHRDPAYGNILSSGGKLVWVDWELGKLLDDDTPPSSSFITGTLDTMAVASLLRVSPIQPHDELEGAVYVLFKALTRFFEPTPETDEQWRDLVEKLRWDDITIHPSELATKRSVMWQKKNISSPVLPVLSFLRDHGHKPISNVFENLFDLDLPLGMDRASWTKEEVTADFIKLVRQAVEAFDVEGLELERVWPLKVLAISPDPLPTSASSKGPASPLVLSSSSGEADERASPDTLPWDSVVVGGTEEFPDPWLEDDEDDDFSPTPWLRLMPPLDVSTSQTSTAALLQRELVAFNKYLAPTSTEIALRHCVLDELTKIVKTVWADASVHVFGSGATGLYLPDSDIDVVVHTSMILNVPTATILKHLDYQLLRHQFVSSSEAIPDARVPILKFVTKPSLGRMKVDVSFNSVNGIEGVKRQLVLMQELEMRGRKERFVALVRVVKVLVRAWGLDVVRDGGLGGLSILLMVVSYFQLAPTHSTKKRDHEVLALDLIGFFQYYINFDVGQYTIFTGNGGGLLHRKKLSSQFTSRGKSRISIQHPVDRYRDLTSGFRKLATLLTRFRDSLRALSIYDPASLSASTVTPKLMDVLSRVSVLASLGVRVRRDEWELRATREELVFEMVERETRRSRHRVLVDPKAGILFYYKL